ncbi:hypothetical protein Pcinc_024534 [Petrolisthes cinctipes]|uniref:Uncharacterized protein n=1 Tax=Petrolisthes cinctipes TaxID=88211 RepID=A0AAE1FB29_PETCI|nr:hypothetical protein Pcinc_024534 [Petrolisthes cinctipes]
MGTRLAGVVQGYRPQVDWGGDTGSATIVLGGHNVVRVGTAGWRRRCLYVLLVALLILSIVNLSITLWILKTLSFSVNGMGALHVVWGGVHVKGTTELLGPVTAAGMGSRIGEDFHLQSYHNLTITTSTTGTRLTSPPPPPPPTTATITTTTSHNTTTARLTSPPIYTPAAASTFPHSSSSSLTSSSNTSINASSSTSNSPSSTTHSPSSTFISSSSTSNTPSSTTNSPSSTSNSPSSTSNSPGSSSSSSPQTSSSTTLISVLNSLIPNSSTPNTLTAHQHSIPPTTSSTVTSTSNSPTTDQVSSTTTTTTPTTASSSTTITTPTSTPTSIPDLPLPTSPKTTTVGKKNVTGFLHINTKDVVAGGRSLTVRSSEDGQELLYYSRNYSRVGAPWLNVTGARGAKISGSLQTPLLVSHGKHELRLESVTRELKARGSEVLMAAWSADIVGVSQGNVSLQSGQGRLRLNTPDLYFANLATETKRQEMTTTTTTTNTTPLPQETQIPAPDSEGIVEAGTTIPPTTPLTPTTEKKLEEEEEGKVEKEEEKEKEEEERVQVFQVCVCGNGKLYLAPPEAPCPYFNYCR